MKAEHIWMDQGMQTFRMLLVPHKDTWKECNIPKVAEEFLVPSVMIYQGIHGGKMAKAASFLNIDTPNVVVSAIKQSENGKDIIFRCVETAGLAAKTTLDLQFAGRKWTGISDHMR